MEKITEGKYQGFSSNDAFYESLIKDIKKAEKSILIESYILRDDDIGRKIRECLEKKLDEGVQVRLFLDGIGSIQTTELFFLDLLTKGAEVDFYRRPLHAVTLLDKMNSRNHRKIIVIDRGISYVGSANIDMETSKWREFTVRIEDEKVAKELARISRSLQMSKEHRPKNEKSVKLDELEIIPGFPTKKGSLIQAKALAMINSAKHEIFLETPYTLFDRKTKNALKRSLKNGVKIKVVSPFKADHFIADSLNKKYVRDLSKKGIGFFHYPEMLHSKIISIDNGKEWMFGSYNFDYRGAYFQFELMIKGDKNCKIWEILNRHIESGLQKSSKIGPRELNNISGIKKITGAIFYPFRYFM